VRKLVLMGSVGVPFPITPGLDAVWGYEPSFENMRGLLDSLPYDRALATDELAELRYQASIQPGFQEVLRRDVPGPAPALGRCTGQRLRRHPRAAARYLIIHGRDDQVIPLDNSLPSITWISVRKLHMFGRCGHWTQIEHAARFNRLVGDFLAEN
jgi:2-hydroxymuconate-semialdehyde hydrolase